MDEEKPGGHWNAPAGRPALDALAHQQGATLPGFYRSMLERHDGGAGFVGDDYLILWPAEQAAAFNREYEVETQAQGLFLVGSNGAGEAYGYDRGAEAPRLISVPFVGMDWSLAEDASPLASAFLALDAPEDSEPDDDVEIVDLKPVLFGGDALDPDNRAVLDREQHFDYVRFWNKTLREARESEQ